MKILHLTTGVSSQSAVYRLHRAIIKQNTESFIYTGLNSLVEDRIINSKNELKLKITARSERLLLNLYPKRQTSPWNIGFFKNCLDEEISKINPDIIHMHWINQFVSIKQIAKFKKPVVWTMHDSWPFTGGCHIPDTCEKFKLHCGSCPQLKSNKENDLSKIIFNIKNNSWSNIELNIIGPSKWMCEKAKSSTILSRHQVTNIPNCIDKEFFTPKDKTLSRKQLGFPIDKKLIMFGATNTDEDENKGYKFILQAFALIRKQRDDVELIVFGTKNKTWCKESGIRQIGFISNPDVFPIMYSAADVVINASRSENFSNIILESLMCGTQVVAFNIGGNSDLIYSEDCGALVSPFNTVELAEKIIICINSQKSPESVRAYAAKNFNEDVVAKKHISLYESLLSL